MRREEVLKPTLARRWEDHEGRGRPAGPRTPRAGSLCQGEGHLRKRAEFLRAASPGARVATRRRCRQEAPGSLPGVQELRKTPPADAPSPGSARSLRSQRSGRAPPGSRSRA